MRNAIYRSRGYLPHIEIRGTTYFITDRLGDSLPQKILSQIREEVKSLHIISKKSDLNSFQIQRLKYLESKRIQDYLDTGAGDCFLKDSRIAGLIHEAILHHNGTRYTSHVFCVMPNHIHWIMTPLKLKGMNKLDSRLIPIMQSFKSFTSHEANKILQRQGTFWNREYYDHVVRSSQEFGKLVIYTIHVKAKLCATWRDWPWTWVSDELKEALKSYE